MTIVAAFATCRPGQARPRNSRTIRSCWRRRSNPEPVWTIMKSELAGGGAGFSFFRAPAVRALLIQAMSFAIVLGLTSAGILTFSLGNLTAALLQGAIAGALSRLRRLAWW